MFNILRTKKLDLKYHTASLLELESGSNDPVSYMLTVVFIAMMSGKAVSLPLMLAQQIGFGLVCGAAAGRLAVLAMDRFSFQIEEGNTIFAVAAMLVSYALPQVIGGNGYLAVYLCGIIMGNSRIPEKRNLMHVFDTVTGIAQMMIFFLLGLLATPSELPAVLLPGSTDHAVYDGDCPSRAGGRSHSSTVPVSYPPDWRSILGGIARCCLNRICDHGCFEQSADAL